MTLFKKVFQSQSEPASSEDVLDEEALRRAFSEAEDATDPLKLDPFAYDAENEAEPDSGEERLDEGEVVQPEMPAMEALEADDFQVIDGAATDDAASFDDIYEDADTARTDDDEVAEEETGTKDLEVAQSDEEIAACLDRALSAETPLQAGEEVVVDTPETSEDINAEGFTEEYQAADHDEEPADEIDVMRFAQEQMATLEKEADASLDPSMDQGLDLSEASDTGLDAVPAPAAGRAGRRAGRVKTRLLGFNRTGDAEHDPFGQAPEATATAQREKYPVGWLVIVEGPGVGHSFSIFTGASMIGRGEDQVIRLDFGDNSISRNNHAAIAYDEEQNKFYIGHGGKSNIIRRNARPVLSTEELHHADLLRIGETTLRFVALCGSDFQWNLSGIAGADSV